MRKLKSVVLASILLLTTVGCSSEGSTKSGNVESGNVAVVNGNEISADYYIKNVNLQKQALESIYGADVWKEEVEEGKTFADAMKSDILEQLINVEVLVSEAKKQNLMPTDEEVQKMVDEVKKTMEENEEYKKNLESVGVDDEFIKRQETEKLALTKYQENFLAKNEVTDEDAKKYYEENKKDFFVDEVQASHILISTTNEDGTPMDDKKKAEAKKKAEDLLNKIKNGEEFASLAKEHSEDPGSGANGGDLGFFGKGEMVPEFEEAAFSLEKGKISELVESQFGYHIIKVTDKNQGQTPFEDIKTQIIDVIKQQKLSENIETLIKNAKIERNEEIIKDIEL